jgi:hypothetical protein
MKTALLTTDFQRIMGMQPPQELVNLFGGSVSNLGEKVEMMKNRQHMRVLTNYMEQVSPELMDTMLASRDIIMVQNFLKVPSKISPQLDPQSVARCKCPSPPPFRTGAVYNVLREGLSLH